MSNRHKTIEKMNTKPQIKRKSFKKMCNELISVEKRLKKITVKQEQLKNQRVFIEKAIEIKQNKSITRKYEKLGHQLIETAKSDARVRELLIDFFDCGFNGLLGPMESYFLKASFQSEIDPDCIDPISEKELYKLTITLGNVASKTFVNYEEDDDKLTR